MKSDCPICHQEREQKRDKFCWNCGYKFRNLRPFFYLLITVLACAAYLYYFFIPCKLPVEYSIGSVDSRLGLTSDEAKAAAIESENIWDRAIGQNVLEYDANARLKIDFLYSEEQEKINQINNQLEELGLINPDAGNIQNQIDEIISEMDSDLANYNKALDEYSQRVSSWQKIGGIRTEKNALDNEYKRLNDWRDRYEAKRKNLLESQALTNQKIELQKQYSINSGKKSFVLGEEATIFAMNNKKIGSPKIEIYAFDGRSGLVMLIAHELGHEFTRIHAKKAESIMYPLINIKQTGSLTTEDINLFCRACNIKY